VNEIKPAPAPTKKRTSEDFAIRALRTSFEQLWNEADELTLNPFFDRATFAVCDFEFLDARLFRVHPHASLVVGARQTDFQ
jgi:hypothetical protein